MEPTPFVYIQKDKSVETVALRSLSIMKFFTLIHICKEEQSIHNNSFTKSFDDQISLYLNCAKQFHRSLVPASIELTILTNDKLFLQRLNTENYPIEILQLNFLSKYPSGIRFYSAHYKLEVFQYLSSVDEEYTALVDSDMLCLNGMPESFKAIINKKLPLYYDITSQVVPAYGAENIIKDKQLVSGKPSDESWAGGEFIAGPPSFFATLTKEIKKVEANYFRHVAALHHQGDEMLTSVAVEALKESGDFEIAEAGALSIVGRFWSYTPLHVQKPIAAHAAHFLLHLPSDKKFIATLSRDKLRGEAFFKKYSRHLTFSRTFNIIFKSIKPYAKRIRKKFAF